MSNEQIEQLFFMQRDATIGIADGVIAFLNPVAVARYPDLAPGVSADSVLPREILMRAEEPFVASATVRQEICTVLGSRVDDMRLFTLIPQLGPGEEEGQLLTNVCSSMRRTLTVLSMATELLTPAIDRLEESKQRSNLTVINKSYYQLQRLCDNLDNFAKFREGQGRLRLAHVDLVRLCRDLIQSVDHFVGKLGHRLHFQSERDQLITVLDGPKVSKLLLTLISNSLKRLPPGGDLYLSLTGVGEDVAISLRDTGAGIPPEEMAHVFAQWGRERSDTDPKAGVGLGMAIAQEIASLHGGTLLLTSHEGRGTTVLLRLPRRILPDGQLQEDPLPYGEGDGEMHLILTELADVLNDEVFGRKYRD